METGHVVRFASQEHPFLVEATPCLDPDCSGTFREYARFLLCEGIVAPERILDTLPRTPDTFRRHSAEPSADLCRESEHVTPDATESMRMQ